VFGRFAARDVLERRRSVNVIGPYRELSPKNDVAQRFAKVEPTSLSVWKFPLEAPTLFRPSAYMPLSDTRSSGMALGIGAGPTAAFRRSHPTTSAHGKRFGAHCDGARGVGVVESNWLDFSWSVPFG
jgi:hypothetical protein